jgi:thiosulfate/3-mercaptopyruvate sulfurtransferase
MRKTFLTTTFLAAASIRIAPLAFATDLPGPIITTEWLAANLHNVQIVDIRSDTKSSTRLPEFETDAKTGKKTLLSIGGHIPGSHLIDFKSIRTERQINTSKVKYMLPEKADWEKIVSSAGINANKPIVLVPVGLETADVDEALRVYWQFKAYGENNIAVLDGGMAAWLIEGRPYDQSPQNIQASGTWSAKEDQRKQYVANSDDVNQAITNTSAIVVDARDLKAYLGLSKRDYVFAYGHIPGAKLYPGDLMHKSENGSVKFYSPKIYQALMAAQGIDPSQPMISYCNSGHLAAGPWFIASQILGNKSAQLYDGSMHEWTLEKRPVESAVSLN